MNFCLILEGGGDLAYTHVLTVGKSELGFGFMSSIDASITGVIHDIGSILPDTLQDTEGTVWNIREFTYYTWSGTGYRLRGSIDESSSPYDFQRAFPNLYGGRADIGEYWGNRMIRGQYIFYANMGNMSELTEADVGKEIPIWLATTPPPLGHKAQIEEYQTCNSLEFKVVA